MDAQVLLERRVGTERLVAVPPVAGVRAQAGVQVEVDLELGPALELLLAWRDRARELGPRSSPARVVLDVLGQIVFARKALATKLNQPI